LAARNQDDAEFDESVSQLKQLLTRINRYVGRHAYLTPDEERDWITKIVESASTLGYNIPVEQMSAQATAQAAPDSRTLLTGLLQMLEQSPHPLAPSPSDREGEKDEPQKPSPPVKKGGGEVNIFDSDTGETTANDEKNEPKE
jgi:hypothetical protein